MALAVFDLDDTLIDTRGVLLPRALDAVARACGVPVERLNARGKKIDEVLRGIELPADLRARAAEAWYDPRVPALEPLPGVREMLARLQGRIHLALLTRGDPSRQRNKISRFGLADRFESIRIRAIEEPGSKA
ncbi:MAG: HAD family hydrolase, partial [Planctomycetota bacterium]